MEHVSARIIRNKLGLLNLAQELGNVSRACKIMGLSRDTFYRYQAAIEAGGVEALIEKTRRKPNQKNRTDELTEAAVVAFALDNPAYGQVRASNELRKAGVFISPAGYAASGYAMSLPPSSSAWRRSKPSCSKAAAWS